MGDMNFPDPSFTTEHDGWSWDGDKWTRTASSNWFDPTVKKVVTGTLANGDAVVLNADGTVSAVGGSPTNLTDSNFLGFSGGDYSDGDTAKVLVNGAIADQSGLTIAKHHYVQGDGTVDTDDTGVFAGTALSSTELIVEGSNHG